MCDDSNPCTDDICTLTGGCEFPAAPGPCHDGDPCTVADQCDDGTCAGISLPCECVTNADCASHKDGDLCNGTLRCNTNQAPYQCVAAEDRVVICPDPVPDDTGDALCLTAHCEPETAACSLVSSSEGHPCDDGDVYFTLSSDVALKPSKKGAL